ncbi:MAG: glycosyltransferase family 2 protein [Litorimonas sp.]
MSDTDTPTRLSVVICIHNALDDVTRCIDSVLASEAAGDLDIVLVDDGSDTPTADHVAAVAKAHPHVRRIRRDEAGGYTVAANTGLAAATGDVICLLNSDTVVPKRWAHKLAAHFLARPDVGIVGPLSNAASWQSVPERSDPRGGWMINALPPGMDVDAVDARCEALSEGVTVPRVPLVNGFCYALHRRLLEAIGPLDEAGFPKGFGEEDDYCLRAADAGFGLLIAIDTYVFHAKSKSYGSERRRTLTQAGQATLKRKHGEHRLKRSTETMKLNPSLEEMRLRLAEDLASG